MRFPSEPPLGRFDNQEPLLISRFTRIITQGRRFIPEVDGLRFVAIAAVVLFHLRADARHYTVVLPTGRGGLASLSGLDTALLRMLDLGHFGVQLFFVLSGFLLALPFAKWRLGQAPRPPLRTYFFRRLTRLEPPYIVSMLLLFLAGIALAALSLALARAGLRPTSLRQIPNRLPNLLASLVYQHNTVFGQSSAINPVAWSLEIEVQFYVLAPILARVFSISSRALRRTILLSLVIAAPAARALAPDGVSCLLNLCLAGFLEYFLSGFLLADLYLVDWREAPARSLRWDLATLVSWPLLAALLFSGRFRPLFAPTILLAYLGAFRGRCSSMLLTRPWITAVGGMCYSMYLLHYFVISLVGAASQALGLGTSFATRLAVEAAIGVPLVLLVTGVFFVFLERPCMDPQWLSRAAARLRRAMTRPFSASASEPPA